MKGFSLVELLVAIAALSLLAIGSAFLTGFAFDARAAIETREQATTDIIRLQSALSFDLTQAARRRARGPDGAKPQTALQGRDASGDGVFLSLVRRGWDSPANDHRPGLQSVAYRLTGGRIERVTRQYVDGAPEAASQFLISGIRAVEVRYLEGDEWVDGWPGSPERPLPRAVRIRLEFAGRGGIDQLFLIAGGGA
jgi:type II secretion system protein J